MGNEMVSPQNEPYYLKPDSHHHRRSDISDRHAPHFWFKKFIRFQRYLGITYRGSAGFDGSISARIRACLIAYDLLTTFALMTYFFLDYFLNKIAIFASNKQEKILMEAITKVGIIASGLQFLAIKMVLLVYGDQILKIICSFDCPARDGLKVSSIERLLINF
jgi:hypothetical protein